MDFSTYSGIYAYIRHSKESQSEGDSVDRQDSLASYWEKTHNVPVNYLAIDAGKSAYSAENIATGSLGQFIADLESNNLPSSSLLLVEGFDRLTRQQLMTALALLQRIFATGAHVYTLEDNNLFTADSLNDLPTMFGILMKIGRANEESATKSRRIKESFARRDQQMIAKTPINYRHLPHWLEYKEGQDKYHINEHADTIRLLFSLYLEGHGVTHITNTLNDKGLLRQGKTEWTTANVSSQLGSRLVLGEWKGHEGVYPTIVSEHDFNAVQAMKRKGTGRRANRLTSVNLFIASIARCSCGKPLHVIRPRGVKRLVCSGTRQGKTGCPFGYKLYNVDAIEMALGLWATETIGTDPEDYTSKLSHLRNALAANEQEQQAHRDALVGLADAIAELGYTQALKDRYKSVEGDLATCIQRAETISLEVQQLERPQTDNADTLAHWHKHADDSDYRRRMLQLMETKGVEFIMDNGKVTLHYQDRSWFLQDGLFFTDATVAKFLNEGD
ncbi:recombinase family protein [Vibrio alginolyticus]|uniref:recombinase family protein n=1 Tax=Vibrio alginolyticus TaxID=663 RepID=UPI001042D04C|nr:recombinase family protein [Vibrio alginolyticus]TDE52094.1 recombinase family protein [Vibrio alginolyticus]